MAGERDAEAKRRGLRARRLPAVRDREAPRRQAEPPRQAQEVRGGGGARGIGGERRAHDLFEVRFRREIEPFGLDESSHRLAVTASLEGARGEGEIDEEAGFFPRPELALLDIAPHVLARRAKPREFPIVDDAGAVARQMSQPSLLHERDQHGGEAVLEGVRPGGENHGTPRGACRADPTDDLVHDRRVPGGKRTRRLSRMDEIAVGGHAIRSLSQRFARDAETVEKRRAHAEAKRSGWPRGLTPSFVHARSEATRPCGVRRR